MRVQPNLSKPLGNKQLTVLTAAKLLSAIGGGIPTGACYALIDVEGANVRWTDDGTTVPTAAIGNRLLKDAGPFLYDGDLALLKFIEESATAKVNVAFYAFADA